MDSSAYTAAIHVQNENTFSFVKRKDEKRTEQINLEDKYIQ